MRWQPYVTKKLCFCELMLMKTSSRVDGAKMITASSWWMPTWRRRLLSPPMPDHQWWTQPLGLLEVSSLVSNNHRLYSPLCCLLCVCCGFCCCINLPHLAAVKTSTDGSNHFVRSSLLPTRTIVASTPSSSTGPLSSSPSSIWHLSPSSSLGQCRPTAGKA